MAETIEVFCSECGALIDKTGYQIYTDYKMKIYCPMCAAEIGLI